MMRNITYKFFLLGFFLFIIGCQTSLAQEKPNYVNFDEVMGNLTFSSRIDKTTAEINQQIIIQIMERKVNFILSKEDEVKLKKAGGNKVLIKTINENISEELKEQIILYKKFTDNYNGQTSIQRKIALEAAREFLQKYSDNSEPQVKEILKYLKEYIAIIGRDQTCYW